MLILLLSFLMIFSQSVMGGNGLDEVDYENIEVDKEGNLVLTKDQYVKLANYIEELKAENLKLNMKLEQANKELEKAYADENPFNFTRLSDKITGAGLAALIILIVLNIN